MTDDERRARLAARHRLAVPASDPVAAARSVIGLHSSDPSTVFLSTRARNPDVTPGEIEEALYETRSLLRILGMRRTMWVTPTDFAPVIDASSTKALIRPQRERTASMIQSSGVSDDGPTWVREVCEATLESLRKRGEATARELTADVPRLSTKITIYKKDGSLAGEVGTSTRILFLLATEGLVVRGRPLGSWVSSQYRWATTESWLGEPLESLDEDTARDRLIKTWLLTFGPGTEMDIKWWTGWTATNVRNALKRVDAVEVALEDGSIGYLHPDDVHETDPASDWVALLPSLDSTTMGWKERKWYMGDNAGQLFDRNGNAGPTVWVNGRVIGGWAQNKSGDVVHETFENPGSACQKRIDDCAAQTRAWIGEIRVTPRFRSPHDKLLSK
ncbi:MAG: winged helix DNA-binding domain-containing protein [Acidimicrobiia bacterium]